MIDRHALEVLLVYKPARQRFAMRVTAWRHAMVWALVSTAALLNLVNQASAQDLRVTEQRIAELKKSVEVDRVEPRKRGLFERTNRKELQRLSALIYERKITYPQVKEYLQLGGDPNVLTNYKPRSLWMDIYPRNLLNKFIAGDWPRNGGGVFQHNQDQRKDRIKSLALLLASGSSPSHLETPPAPSSEDLKPILWASIVGDKEAVALMLDQGADVNVMQKQGAMLYGPPLLEAFDEATADTVLAYKPDLALVDEDDRSLIERAVHREPSYDVLWRVRWMQKRGLRFAWKTGGSYDPIRRARLMLSNRYPNPNDPDATKNWPEIAEILPLLKKTD